MPSDEMTQRGDLKDRPLPDLFMDLSALGQSGALTLTRAGITKTIYFEAGKLIFAASTDPNDRLGEVLVRQKVIGIRDLMAAQAKMKPGVRLGALLVEQKLLAPEKLVDAVLAQVRGIILGAFVWTEGEFVFDPRLEVSKEVIRLDLPAREIVREGIGRIDNVEWLVGSLQRLEPAWQLTPECEERLAGWALGEAENRVLAQLGEPRKFGELADGKWMAEIDLARFLLTLQILGIIRAVSEDDASLDAMMDDAFGSSAAPVLSPAKPAAAAPPREAAEPESAPEPEPRAAPVATPRKTVPPAEKSPEKKASAPTKKAAPASAPEAKPAAAAAPPPAEQPAPPPAKKNPPASPAEKPAMSPAAAPEPAPPKKSRPPTDDIADFTADDFEFGGSEPALPSPSVPETVAKVEAPADEISRAITEFGIRHKAVLNVLHTRDKAKTGSFVGFCLREVRKGHPRLFQGIEPDLEGGLAIDKLLTNIRGQKLQNYNGGLRDLHEVLIRRAKTWQGQDVARQCRQAAGLGEG